VGNVRSVIKVGDAEIRVTGRFLKTARLEGEKYKYLNNPKAVIEDLRKSGQRIDLFTFMQRLPETAPKHQYKMEWDNFAAIRVTTFEHWWTEQIGKKTRNAARHGEKKGVVLREVPFDDDLVRGIQGIYNESPIRQGLPNVHYKKSFETMRVLFGTFLEGSVFIGAYLDDVLIGFAKLVPDETGTQAGLMNIFSMTSHRDKAPTNALIAQAVRSCADRGISYLVYANFAYGNKQNSSLSEFKERNGFEKIDIPRYYVPLTAAGQLALRLGLHRKLVDRLPEPCSEKLREIRLAWYRRKFQSVAESS